MSHNETFGITTAQLAALIGIEPHSIRVRFSQKQHYFGLTPRKLPNGRLLWPVDSVARLLEGKGGAE